MSETEVLEEIKVPIIYGGIRYLNNLKGKEQKYFVHYYAPYNENSNTHTGRLLTDRQLVSGRPGQMYELTMGADKQTYYSRGSKAPRYLGIHPDKELCAQLIAEHSAAETAVLAVSRLQKDKVDNALFNSLKTARSIYRKLPITQRASFLFVVHEMVTRRLVDED